MKREGRTMMNTNKLKRVRSAYAAATGGWSGADWTHENGRDADGDPLYCEGGDDDCETCERATSDAQETERLAAAALAHAACGEWSKAAELATAAADLELAWGDNPTWRPFADAMHDGDFDEQA